MSDLERRVKPLLKPMILGNNVALPTGQQLTIATWAAMKTMVHEFVWGKDQPPVSPQADRDIVMHEQRPPANMQIRLAAVESVGRPAVLSQRVYARTMPSGQSLTAQDFTFCVTIALGCAVVQVFGGPAAVANKFDQTARTAPNFLSIYPPNIDVVHWPPRKTLDDASLEVFAHPLQPAK